MRIRFVTVTLFLISLFPQICRAQADFTGTWQGTIDIKAAGSSADKGEFLLNLRQAGSRISGTVGPARTPLSNGSVLDNVATFDVQMGSVRLTFRMQLASQKHLTGVGLPRAEGTNVEAAIELWKIAPTDVTGRWTGTVTMSGDSPINAWITFRQYGASVTGATSNGPIENGVVYGDRLLFDTVAKGITLNFDLRVAGDQMSGSIITAGAPYKAVISLRKSG